MTPERIDELIALAALGELSPADERELDAAVRTDPALAAELDEALATAGAIQSIGAEAPPTGLRANVLAAIASTPQDSDTPSLDAPVAPVGAPVTSLQEARSRRRLLPILLGAAAAIVFVLGAFIVSNEASAPDQYAAVLEASDAETHTLAGDMGTLTVTYSPSHDAMVVAGEGVPTLSAAETYQLWFDVDGHMVPAGLFRPDEDGNVRERIVVNDGIGASVNVTEEPAGGSEEPTLPVLATTA
jgi:anti-sigma-K factor RskA